VLVDEVIHGLGERALWKNQRFQFIGFCLHRLPDCGSLLQTISVAVLGRRALDFLFGAVQQTYLCDEPNRSRQILLHGFMEVTPYVGQAGNAYYVGILPFQGLVDFVGICLDRAGKTFQPFTYGLQTQAEVEL